MNADLAFEVERWLEKARDDLGVAQHLNELYHPKPVEIICFHCQQAAEKAIKAVILARGVQKIPKSHELVFLLEQLGVTIEERLLDFADSLTQYAVKVRYPMRCIYKRVTAAQHCVVHKRYSNGVRRRLT